MKRSVTYPDWVEKYRGKGRTIRKVRNGYGLYECTSVYVPGMKYPKSVQTYLGMITEKDGFIPKGSSPRSSSSRIEYGLSHFIMANFCRDLIRSSYNATREFVVLAVVYYLFGNTDPQFIRSTYVTHGMEKQLDTVAGKLANDRKLSNLCKKIDTCITERIPDKKDRKAMITLLLSCSIGDNENTVGEYPYPLLLTQLAERYGLYL